MRISDWSSDVCSSDLSGRVSAILPDVQADSRTLSVRIELPNRGGRLKPGMFATVSFGGSAQTALLVPSEALIRTGTRTLVMLALDKGRSQPAEVHTGQESAHATETPQSEERRVGTEGVSKCRSRWSP